MWCVLGYADEGHTPVSFQRTFASFSEGKQVSLGMKCGMRLERDYKSLKSFMAGGIGK